METPLRLLHVEDTPADADMLLDILERGGYAVTTTRVETAEAMRAALGAGGWDLIISDHHMPHFSSLGALETLQASGADIPFIIVSATMPEEMAMEAMRLGARDFVMKNNLQRLAPAVGRELREAQSRRAKRVAERAVAQLTQQNRQILDSAGEGIYGLDSEGKTTFINPAATRLLGYTVAETLNQSMHALTHHTRPNGTPYPRAECPIYAAFTDGQARRVDWEVFWRKDGTSFPVEYSSNPIVEDGKIAGAVVAFRDITERVRANAQIQQQLNRLDALRQIDIVLLSSVDLRLTLEALSMHIVNQLRVDAAAVLLLNRSTHTLGYRAGRGFRTNRIAQANVRLGESLAGQAALERRMVHIADLAERALGATFKRFVSDENFVAYFAVPLVAKGMVNGVLEIFHRAPLTPDDEWRAFLETLAGQTAIAIESAALFDDLQRSHSELILAYDATIEGWSRAMDLRDKETEGHTQRVTEMTLELARAFDFSGAELVQLRRGGLLHDIGKLGIPDAILLKPGKLTDAEWALMRQHPQFAYEMLAPIEYLKPALDIPYCHHEKWDGSGYPRGLRGEAIPLAARLFASTDVYDALTSERPYRAAWSKTKTLEHIQSLSGTHFDPRVVDAFAQMLRGG